VPVAPRKQHTLRFSSRRSSTHLAIAAGWSPDGKNGATTFEPGGTLARDGPAPTPLDVRASSAVVPKVSWPAGRAFPEAPDAARAAVVDAANRRLCVADGTRDVGGGAEVHARREDSAEAVRRARRRIPAGSALVPASAPALIPRPDVGGELAGEMNACRGGTRNAKWPVLRVGKSA
jgi:hypothetical protein